jgi:hypothetical protein
VVAVAEQQQWAELEILLRLGEEEQACNLQLAGLLLTMQAVVVVARRLQAFI